MSDDESRAISELLRAPKAHVSKRMGQLGLVMPLWLTRALEELARSAYRKGLQDAHAKRTIPTRQSTPWDDEATPVRNPWEKR